MRHSHARRPVLLTFYCRAESLVISRCLCVFPVRFASLTRIEKCQRAEIKNSLVRSTEESALVFHSKLLEAPSWGGRCWFEHSKIQALCVGKMYREG
ncbi:hypothetical protein IWX49DRAFT_410991 [Phyllosticta citricarpa]